MSKDQIICLPKVEYFPPFTDQKDVRYCGYYRRKGHTVEQRITFRRIFDEKHKVGEVLFKKGAVNDLLFRKHDEKGKGQVMMALHTKIEIGGDEAHQPKGEPDLACMG